MQSRTRGDYDEHSVQMLWGGDIGDVDVVLVGQFRQNSRLGWDERDLLANSGLTISSNAPGNWYLIAVLTVFTRGPVLAHQIPRVLLDPSEPAIS